MELPEPEPAAVGAAYARPFGAALVLAGLVHVLAPRLLLGTARVGYDLVLDVEFEASGRSPRRVRVVGLGLVAAGAHLLYHGGIVPGPDAGG
jgi:uncharacterized protein YjeT (DUF2065 family)